MAIRVTQRHATPDDVDVLDRHWLPPRAHAALTSLAAFFLYFLLAWGMQLAAVAILLGMANPLRSAGIDVDFVPDLWQKVLLIAALWGPAFLVPAMLAVRRYRRVKAQRLDVWNDRHEGGIEVIDVDAAAYTTVQSGRSMLRLHLFEVRPGEVLCLASDNQALRSLHARSWTSSMAKKTSCRKKRPRPSWRHDFPRSRRHDSSCIAGVTPASWSGSTRRANLWRPRASCSCATCRRTRHAPSNRCGCATVDG
jgi:hypothetical protein